MTVAEIRTIETLKVAEARVEAASRKRTADMKAGKLKGAAALMAALADDLKENDSMAGEVAGKRKRNNKDEEHQIQVACVQWFRYQYARYAGVFFAVPNGGMRKKTTAAKMKEEGALKGVADLMLLVARRGYHGLCIEMKTRTG